MLQVIEHMISTFLKSYSKDYLTVYNLRKVLTIPILVVVDVGGGGGGGGGCWWCCCCCCCCCCCHKYT